MTATITAEPATFHVGVDLGCTSIKCSTVSMRSGVPGQSGEFEVPLDCAATPEAVLDLAVDVARRAIAPLGHVDGVALAVPGHVDQERGVAELLPNLPGGEPAWRQRPIAEYVSDRIGVPVSLLNDARAMTVGELRLGAGRGIDHMLCVVLGTGIGGGVVMNGELQFGSSNAGEIGHVTVDPSGSACGCGNHGCLETLAGAKAIARDAGYESLRSAAAAAREGDESARQAFSSAGQRIGQVLGSATALIWPQRIVIGGGTAQVGSLILDPIRSELALRGHVTKSRLPDVRMAELGVYSGAIGAALWSAEHAHVRSHSQ